MERSSEAKALNVAMLEHSGKPRPGKNAGGMKHVEQANEALQALKHDLINGAAVLRVRSNP